MKITPTLEEVENGLMSRRWTKKQREGIAASLTSRLPVVMRKPMPVAGRYLTMVRIHELHEQESGFAELSFTPVWCRAMIGCHARSSDIRLLVVKFDHGQFEFDDNQELHSNRRMEGPGCDPEDVEKSEYALAKLIEQDTMQVPVKRACHHIWEKFKKSA